MVKHCDQMTMALWALALPWLVQITAALEVYDAHDFRGSRNGVPVADISLFDRGPHDLGTTTWAQLMNNATHQGTYPVRGFNVSSPRRTSMDGWTVTYSANGWIDYETTLRHRFGPEQQADHENQTWAGASVRLNPPRSLYEAAVARSDWEISEDYVQPGAGLFHDRLDDSIRHVNWRVCAYRVWGMDWQGDASEAWNSAPNGTCGGMLPEGCLADKVEGVTLRTSVYNTECPSMRFDRPGAESREGPDDCLADVIDASQRAVMPASSLPLRFSDWDRSRAGWRPWEVEEEPDWLHGAELWNVGSTMEGTESRLRALEEEGNGAFKLDGKMEEMYGRSEALLLVWVHNEDGLAANTSSLSDVTFSFVCFNGINETDVGEARLEEVREQYREDSGAGVAVVGWAVFLGGLAIAGFGV